MERGHIAATRTCEGFEQAKNTQGLSEMAPGVDDGQPYRP